MEALLYADWDTLKLTSLPIPEPREGEVRIRVEAAGICGSELEAVRKRSPRRTPPLVLGHEFTGIIDSRGPGVEGLALGQPVVANAVIACGGCDCCQRGDTHLCVNRQLFGMHRPGAFAEYVCAPAKVLIPRPTGVDPPLAALTEPLANGVHIARLLELGGLGFKRIAVFGAGPIGLLAIQVLKRRFGCDIAAIDLSVDRLEIARRVGANGVFRGDLNEMDFDASLDAVGAASTKSASITCLRPGGTAIWIGLHENESPFNAYDLILPEKRLLGSYACTQKELAEALDLIASGDLDLSWISEFPLAQAEMGFQRMLRPGPGDIKGVITMS